MTTTQQTITNDIVGLQEAAEILGAFPSNVHEAYKDRAIAKLSCGLLWLRSQFTEPDSAETPPPKDTFVGFKEVREMLDITAQGLTDRVKKARNPKQKNRLYFPLPVKELACGPIWLREDVEGYKEARKRKP